MAKHNHTGNKGEELARRFLEDKGFEIKATNFRYKRAEIDIIAEKLNLLIFVEVKTRTGISYGEPEAFVSRKKENLIIDAAEFYIHEINWLYDIRFDIISVEMKPEFSIYHFEDAFY